jgi:hypothetical protein
MPEDGYLLQRERGGGEEGEMPEQLEWERGTGRSDGESEKGDTKKNRRRRRKACLLGSGWSWPGTLNKSSILRALLGSNHPEQVVLCSHGVGVLFEGRDMCRQTPVPHRGGCAQAGHGWPSGRTKRCQFSGQDIPILGLPPGGSGGQSASADEREDRDGSSGMPNARGDGGA